MNVCIRDESLLTQQQLFLVTLVSTASGVVSLTNNSASAGAFGSAKISDDDSACSDLDIPIHDPMLDQLTSIERFTELSGPFAISPQAFLSDSGGLRS